MNLENDTRSDNVKEYYEILRTRQLQIIQIIKETTFLLNCMEAKAERGARASVPKADDGGLRLAFSMIHSLANILDEQMKALNVWERVLLEDNRPAVHNPGNREIRDYYDINPN